MSNDDQNPKKSMKDFLEKELKSPNREDESGEEGRHAPSLGDDDKKGDQILDSLSDRVDTSPMVSVKEFPKQEGVSGDQQIAQQKGIILPEQALPTNLFIIPVNSSLIFPTLMAPMMVSLPKSIATVEHVIGQQRIMGLLLTRGDEMSENAHWQDLYEFGVAVKILKRLKMPDGSVNLLLHSIKRFKIKKALSEHPHLVAEPSYIDDQVEKSLEFDALSRSVVAQVKKLSETNPFFTEEMRLAMINAPGPGTVADLVAFALSLPKSEAQTFLETASVKKRFEFLLVHLKREQDVADVQKRITDEVNHKITKMQREFFLREQLRSIKKELGVEEDSKDRFSRTFKSRIELAQMPEEVKKIALEELERFESLPETSPDYNLTRNYLETLCSLPWSIETPDTISITDAKAVLERDHYGLEKVKKRILEFLAVRKLKNDKKGSILCLVGPPGVGKTSIGRSIAETMGRKFYRFSLGGMRDEAEIKGHRRTYVGAMPGKVINAIRRAGAKNAVLMLDEIDKLSHSYQGDPASALLEVLDPEQNATFVDHYLDVPFDLSKVLFLATANSLSSIPPALLDRMEILEVAGYTLEEKEQIAERYIVPKELNNHGLKKRDLRIPTKTLKAILQDYAREPGLRVFQQQLATICRKIAAQKSEFLEDLTNAGQRFSKVTVEPADLQKLLGPKRHFSETNERIVEPGVVVGLAWTPMGGEILFIEAIEIPGTGQLKLTGKMGETMTESAQLAFNVVKKKLAKSAYFDFEKLKQKDIHLHIPAGAIPKDGPSAGITMATALYGLLTDRVVKKQLAMTGELSLTGRVLPVGGIKEKVLGAKRAGIREIILCKDNERDLLEVQPDALNGLKFYFVQTVNEVFDLALEAKTVGKVVHSKVLKKLKKAKPVKQKGASTKKRLLKIY